ncbi:MAG: helix-hairpin-helix domain-containing protein, partial [Propionibacteriaceae bacterium]|nr:helix-hairpin-helix domain-containing protein [Propionibacteriaceae bacterium]
TSVMNSSDMEMLFEMLSNFSQPLCWIMGAILTVMIYTAISKNENLKASRMLQSNQKVSINTATVQQLEVVPGIGPVIAQRIVAFRAAHRGFSSLEQLIEVDGIGHRNFPAISKYLQL